MSPTKPPRRSTRRGHKTFFSSSFKSPHTTIPTNQPTNEHDTERERKTRVVIHTRTQHEANGKEKGGRERKASIKRSSPKLVRVLSTRCCRLLLLLLLLHSSFYHNFFSLSLFSFSVYCEKYSTRTPKTPLFPPLSLHSMHL